MALDVITYSCVYASGIVGSVVLPILGAVPDGAIVLFSGLGSNAKSQVAVGVGALAGSTIMLLTLPWFLSVLAGRVDCDAKGPVYRRVSFSFSLLYAVRMMTCVPHEQNIVFGLDFFQCIEDGSSGLRETKP